MPLRAILFDLDGTLVQTREASWSLFSQTNQKFSLGVDSRDAFFDLFQENFFRSLRKRCEGRADVEGAVAHFLGLLRGQYCPPLIPGMGDVIKQLASRFTLAVISTNAIDAIRKILEGSGFANCFAHVFAGDVEPDKSACIRRFLSDPAYTLGRRCSPDYDESNQPGVTGRGDVVLVTDSVGDVKEARSSGIDAIGVSWGMHGAKELLAAGASRVAVWPQELVAWLVPAGSEPAAACSCTIPALDTRLQAAAVVRNARRQAPESFAPRGLDPELLSAVARLGFSSDEEEVMTMKVLAEGFNSFDTKKRPEGTIKFLRDPKSVIALIASKKLGEHILLVQGGTTTFLAPALSMGSIGIITMSGAPESHLGILSREFQTPCVMTAYLTSSKSRYDTGADNTAHFEEIVKALDGKKARLECEDRETGRIVLID